MQLKNKFASLSVVLAILLMTNIFGSNTTKTLEGDTPITKAAVQELSMNYAEEPAYKEIKRLYNYYKSGTSIIGVWEMFYSLICSAKVDFSKISLILDQWLTSDKLKPDPSKPSQKCKELLFKELLIYSWDNRNNPQEVHHFLYPNGIR